MRTLFFALFSVITLFLVWPVSVSVGARLMSVKSVSADVSIRLLSGLIPIIIALEMNILNEPVMTLYLVKHSKKIVWWELGQETRTIGKIKIPTNLIFDRVHVKKLDITGELGIKDDAFLTAMISGVLMNILILPLMALLRDSAKPYVYIRPVFDREVFLINLTGIVSFVPIHIISAIVTWKLKNGKESKWHILSKTL